MFLFRICETYHLLFQRAIKKKNKLRRTNQIKRLNASRRKQYNKNEEKIYWGRKTILTMLLFYLDFIFLPFFFSVQTQKRKSKQNKTNTKKTTMNKPTNNVLSILVEAGPLFLFTICPWICSSHHQDSLHLVYPSLS